MSDGDEAAALAGVSRTLRTLADGTVRLQVDIEPRDAQTAMRLFGAPGTGVALARMGAEAAAKAANTTLPASPEREYGAYAHALERAGFFTVVDVVRAIGSEAIYAAWVRSQPCAIDRRMDTDADSGQQSTQYAHVRRANEGGTAFKPPYRALPLCSACHRRQHNDGEAAALSLGTGRLFCVETAKAWFDKAAASHLREWARTRLKHQLAYESWRLVPPEVLLAWAQKHGVDKYLPAEYRQ